MKTLTHEKRPIRDLPVEFLLMLLMSASMVYPFVKALDLGQSILSIALFNFICIALWTVAFRRNRNLLLAVVLLCVAACGLSLLYLRHSGEGAYSPFHYNVDDFMYWANTYLKGYHTENALFSNVMVYLFSAFVCLTVSFFTVRRFSLSAVVLCGASCFVSLFVIGHEIDMPSLFAYILAAILYFLLYNYRRNARDMGEGEKPGLPAFMASSLPLVALVLALTVFLSGVVEIDPAWMKETRDKLIKKTQPVNDTVAKNSGTLIISSDELGGNLYLNDDVVMVVACPVGNVYLKSLSKDEYTGHSWVQTDTNAVMFDTGNDMLKDTRETADAAPGLAGSDSLFNELFPSYEMTVKYMAHDPGIVYAPLKMSGLTAPCGVILVGGDEMMFAQGGDAGLTWGLRFYQPQYGSEALADLARKSSQQYYKTLASKGSNGAAVAGRYKDMGGETENYLQLPKELPARDRQLAQQITRGKTNDYDKAMAIEDYLIKNDTYTLTPGSVDRGTDFVDQFLFVNKQGYCTYYASAMAVLLRCAGIPSRYVEGYVLPQRDPGTGLFNVTKRQGHAWVEAYFQGLGWIQFEPTATFSEAPPPTATPKPSGAPKAPSARPSPSVGPKATEPAVETSANRPRPINLGLPLILAAAALLLSMLFVLPHRANRSIGRMNPRDAALLLFGQYLKLLAAQDVALQNGETPATFAGRVDGLYGFSDSAFEKSAAIFQLARYSEHEITEEQRGMMLEFRAALLSASRKKLGWPLYLFYRFIWTV